MNKLNAIVQNPSLEEHIIFFVGIRHMQENWEEHVDPKIPYDEELLELYYREMKRGSYQDLKRELKHQHGISSKDDDFKQTLEAAIGIIVARHGMEAILEASKEFLYAIQEPDLETEVFEFDFEAPIVHCPICTEQAIHLGLEDVPAPTLGFGNPGLGTNFGYCRSCIRLFPVH